MFVLPNISVTSQRCCWSCHLLKHLSTIIL